MLDFGFYNMDCMVGMKEFPDNYFDLAIVDPPYGAGVTEGGGCKGWFAKYHQDKNGGGVLEPIRTAVRQVQTHRIGNAGSWGQDANIKKIISWDVAPKEEYFEELFRISRNQSIWGGNYFDLPPTRCFIVWRKTNVPEDFSMAMAEYAWTSFDGNAKVFEFSAVGQPNRFHPTQKPVELYEWTLNRFANDGDTIIDTHVGSASSLIACHRTNHKFVGFEIDETYYKKAKERLDAETAQQTIWSYMGDK